jgi:small-conductance mechanosensitive channel
MIDSRWWATIAVTVVVTVVFLASRPILDRRLDEGAARYHAGKLIRYAVGVFTIVALAVIWRGFAGRAGEIVGFAAAGVAFAMQEVIGALAGWFNIVSGHIFKVGDRIEMAGVRGDVIDVTLLRTKIMEIGSPGDGGSWVKGRQYTGRIVAVSNKATFTDPVFNFSAIFDFVWEELTVPISYRSDWKVAEQIIREEAQQISRTQGAEEAIAQMSRRYPVPRTEVEPRVFVRATDNYLELSARFVVPVRMARTSKDAMTRRIYERLQEAGVEIGSSTSEVTVFRAGDGSESVPESGAAARDGGR